MICHMTIVYGLFNKHKEHTDIWIVGIAQPDKKEYRSFRASTDPVWPS